MKVLGNTITSSSCSTIDVELSKSFDVVCESPLTIHETIITWKSNNTEQSYTKTIESKPLEIDTYNNTNGTITKAKKTITISNRNEVVEVNCFFLLPDNTTKSACVNLKGDRKLM